MVRRKRTLPLRDSRGKFLPRGATLVPVPAAVAAAITGVAPKRKKRRTRALKYASMFPLEAMPGTKKQVRIIPLSSMAASNIPVRSWSAWKRDSRTTEKPYVGYGEWMRRGGKGVDLKGFDDKMGWVSRTRKLPGKLVLRSLPKRGRRVSDFDRLLTRRR